MIGQTINNYTIESVLGEGGMGIVYLAKHKYLEINSAVKVLHPQFSRNQQIKDRFINEALILSKLDSPYIVKIRDFFDQGENLFLIMEFVHGVPLDDYIHKIYGPVPELRAREIFKKVMLGVHAAHIKGIVHRDIKPSNILLENNDTPKILDFGIAKLMENDVKMTTPGSRMGSIIYMSPEQILGKEIDTRTDIYSLGLLYYEMLTGKNPFDLPDITEYTIHSNIINNPVPSPRNYYPHITDHSEEIISKAIAKDPAERFRNCEEFIEALMNPGYTSGLRQRAFIMLPPQPVVQPSEPQRSGLKTSKEILAEQGRQTVLQASSPTVLQQSQVKPKHSNRTLFIILGIIWFVISAVVLVYIFNNDDDELNIRKKTERDPVKKETEQKKETETKPEIKQETKQETPPDTVKSQTETTTEDESTKTEEESKKKQAPPKKKYSPPKQNNNNNNNNNQPTKKPRTTFEN